MAHRERKIAVERPQPVVIGQASGGAPRSAMSMYPSLMQMPAVRGLGGVPVPSAPLADPDDEHPPPPPPRPMVPQQPTQTPAVTFDLSGFVTAQQRHSPPPPPVRLQMLDPPRAASVSAVSSARSADLLDFSLERKEETKTAVAAAAVAAVVPTVDIMTSSHVDPVVSLDAPQAAAAAAAAGAGAGAGAGVQADQLSALMEQVRAMQAQLAQVQNENKTLRATTAAAASSTMERKKRDIKSLRTWFVVDDMFKVWIQHPYRMVREADGKTSPYRYPMFQNTDRNVIEIMIRAGSPFEVCVELVGDAAAAFATHVSVETMSFGDGLAVKMGGKDVAEFARSVRNCVSISTDSSFLYRPSGYEIDYKKDSFSTAFSAWKLQGLTSAVAGDTIRRMSHIGTPGDLLAKSGQSKSCLVSTEIHVTPDSMSLSDDLSVALAAKPLAEDGTTLALPAAPSRDLVPVARRTETGDVVFTFGTPQSSGTGAGGGTGAGTGTGSTVPGTVATSGDVKVSRPVCPTDSSRPMPPGWAQFAHIPTPGPFPAVAIPGITAGLSGTGSMGPAVGNGIQILDPSAPRPSHSRQASVAVASSSLDLLMDGPLAGSTPRALEPRVASTDVMRIFGAAMQLPSHYVKAPCHRPRQLDQGTPSFVRIGTTKSLHFILVNDSDPRETASWLDKNAVLQKSERQMLDIEEQMVVYNSVRGNYLHQLRESV